VELSNIIRNLMLHKYSSLLTVLY